MSTESLHIIHVDMDAFYAAIEQRDRPGLRGKPVIVGGRPDSRSVVSTASYEARKFGIHSAMPTPTAHRLCPHGIFLPVRIKEYAAVGRQIRDIFHAFTPLVEPLSLDEAFLDVTGCEGLFGSTIEIAKQIKQRIWDETHLVASVGVAHCKFLAKLASDLDKPDGFVIIPTDKIRETLDPLPVSRLPGVGAKGEKRLHQLGIRTVKQLADMPLSSLEISLGKSGRYLWNLAHGIDDREVIPDERAKRISTETTFAKDIGDRESLRIWLLSLVEQLSARLRRHQMQARTFDLKIRTSEFHTHTRSATLKDATNVTEVIWQQVKALFEQRAPSSWLPIRLLGVGASNLVRGTQSQGDLFDEEWKQKQRSLDTALDAIRQQFGQKSVRRGEHLRGQE